MNLSLLKNFRKKAGFIFYQIFILAFILQLSGYTFAQQTEKSNSNFVFNQLNVTTTQDFNVSNAVLGTGTVTQPTETLYDFKKVYLGAFSTRQWVRVNASGLNTDLTVIAPTDFEVSLQCNAGYASSITILKGNGTLTAVLVYIRFKPASIGVKSGNVTISGASNTITLAVSGTCIAKDSYIPATYYQNVTATSGSALKTQLCAIITAGQKSLDYTNSSPNADVWQAYQTTDLKYNGKIWDVYTDKACVEQTFEFTYKTSQQSSTSASVEGQFYNREHTLPKSWFGQSTAAPFEGTDVMQLLPADAIVNGRKSNYPFGTTSGATISSNGTKLGACTYPGFTGTVIEPIDEYKGDIARIYFYMATRYENVITNWTLSTTGTNAMAGNAYPAYKSWFINMLLEWNVNDPVSQKEIERNQAVYLYQNNRNPFVDHPEWAALVWNGTPPTPTKFKVTFTVTDGTNPVSAANVTFNGTTLPTSATGVVEYTNVSAVANATYLVAKAGFNNSVGVLNITGDTQVPITLVSTGTGIFDNKENSFVVFPNPSNGTFKIQFDSETFGYEPVKVTVTDISGKNIYSAMHTPSANEVNLQNFKNGIYMISIENSKNTLHQKLVLSK